MVLELDPRHRDEVRRILACHVPRARAYVFGSRANGRSKRFSDLDIAIEIEDGLTIATLAALREAFSESDLPMTVDIVDWNTLDPEFRAVIAPERVPL
ncbi:nucleotidyltransferase domain-containing protein [soil metagenome]